ncbi:hypothetical protein GCM10010520_17260 [Rhizobium viscosum]|uniref:THIF-type NAD/FAD binding fold domain-containing protein n=1 Tax=Rhizobium viscosum TaxID=1673 RepID=A0ABR9IX04_RHIVS|nr:ThiF family adenylyltransferase [Rhizobium viscosum]MBE1507736.1 hypothetical protein [Rhizobium viscosum]
MVNYRSKRLSAAASAPVVLPNFFAHSLGRGGRGALFTGICADAAEEQSPNVTRAAFGVSLRASDIPAENEYISATIDNPRLREIDFVIIGCGGLGSQISIQLAALGARHFLLMDAGRIDKNNLSDLGWATEVDLGCLKTDRLASYLASRFSAKVFALPEFAGGVSALRLIADYADNPFVVLAGDDSRPAQEFLTACRASHAGLPPCLNADSFAARCIEGPLAASRLPSADDDAFFANLAVSKITQECLSKGWAPWGRRWVLELKSDHAELRSFSKTLRM